MSFENLVFLAVLLLAFCIYFPIMRLARQDMAARTAHGLSNTTILFLLAFPLLGPLLYLVLRSNFRV
ncbi:MAG: hypothetical protein HC821_05935 [Lewinella sp.]|nr:hypothetical protein [Lewinella sp.]